MKPMDPLQWIVDSKLRQAAEDGAFDDLPGLGKPLEFDAMEDVAPELRSSYTLLKNSGCLPEELELQREHLTLAALLEVATEGDERARLLARKRDTDLRWELVRERRRRGR